ncbi:MAG: hypothetical protein WCT04_06990 [Planctomycetota bacterium]
MNNLRIIVGLCFAAAFSAGIMVGKVWERSLAKGPSDIVVVAAQPGPTIQGSGPGPEVGPDHVPGPQLVDPNPGRGPGPVPNRPNLNTPPKPTGPQSVGPPSWLKELNLSPEQSDQMRSIWGEVMKNNPMNHERRDALRKERDEAIRSLMTDDQRKQQAALYAQYDAKNEEIDRYKKMEQDSQRKQRDEALKALFEPEQRKQYDEALARYAQKSDELAKEWKKSFDDAIEKTRGMLTPDQRVKYDNFRKGRDDSTRHRFGPDWPREGERWNGSRPDMRNTPKQ